MHNDRILLFDFLDDHCLFRGRIHPLYCWLLDRDPEESWKEDLVCELRRMSRFDKSTDAPCDDLLCFFLLLAPRYFLIWIPHLHCTAISPSPHCIPASFVFYSDCSVLSTLILVQFDILSSYLLSSCLQV
jgi:hypothetical protein